ncbi:MAG TPA: septum formation family protein [Micromonospora sp.]
MRRWPGGIALGALMAVLLTGCGAPGGADGDLTDDWKGLPHAQAFVPQAGACHSANDTVGYLSAYVPIDCSTLHRAETVHVGTFTGADADRVTPPPAGSPAMLAAFADCDARTKQFVGADWRGARLSVRVLLPSPENWAGGGRWYRCDVFELGTSSDGLGDDAAQRTGSLRDALKGPSPLAYTCIDKDGWWYLVAIGCDQPHRFEYVGVWTAPYPSNPDFKALAENTRRHCRSVIARYVGVPDDVLLEYRTGLAYRVPSKLAWAQGDRGIRCFLYSDRKILKRSLKGTGTKGLPLN